MRNVHIGTSSPALPFDPFCRYILRMSKATKTAQPKRITITGSAGDTWMARESSSGKFVVVEPAKRSKRFNTAAIRNAVRKVAKAQA
jgi:hypothetical protein